MPDATIINKQVRRYLDLLNVQEVDILLPVFNNNEWQVRLAVGGKVIGKVYLDAEGTVQPARSFPS